jgi:hypothetical protein
MRSPFSLVGFEIHDYNPLKWELLLCHQHALYRIERTISLGLYIVVEQAATQVYMKRDVWASTAGWRVDHTPHSGSFGTRITICKTRSMFSNVGLRYEQGQSITALDHRRLCCWTIVDVLIFDL